MSSKKTPAAKPEEKKNRPSAEIKQEFQNLAFKSGNLQYAIAEQQRDLGMINTQLRDLSLEYTAADNAEKAEAAKVAADKAAADRDEAVKETARVSERVAEESAK